MPGTSRSGGNRTTSDDNFPQDGLPSRPNDFTPELNQVWNSLLEQIPHELLRRVDGYQLGILCEFIIRERKLAAACRDDLTDDKLLRAHLQAAQHVAKLSAMYGLSPIDRRRIRLLPTKVEDEIDEWANS
jgi:hypothetical protein